MITNNCGIYKITNTITGDYYIGSACNISNRWSLHRRTLANNKHHSIHLQRAYNKYGAEYFKFSVLEYCEKEKLIEREQYYIDSKRPSYNILPIAGSSLGIKRSEEAKRKMSEAWKTRLPVSDETRHKMSDAQKGKHPTEEAIYKRSEALKGRHLSEEHKRKISEIRKGVPLSEETKHKISEALSGERNYLFGKHLLEETKHKLSELNKGELNPNFGKRRSAETLAKMSEAQKGKHVVSEEVRIKLSEALKAYWAKRKAEAQNAMC